jgi:hypothetical protein
MSRNVKSNSSAKKPYCKVCHDAGKPESEYTNHWVKSLPDRTGKTTVTCPTLLSNECRYCYKAGHTAKFCPVIEKNKKDQEKADRLAVRQVEEAKKAKIEKSKQVKRGFAALQEDSSESEVENIKVSVLPTIVVEEFPALGAVSRPKMAVHLPSVKQEAKTGWADIAAKPKVVPVKKDNFLIQLEERSMIKNLPQSALKPKVEPKQSINQTGRDYTKPIYTTNWADWTDSDSDEEEEAQVAPSGPPMPYKQGAVNMTDIEYDSDW